MSTTTLSSASDSRQRAPPCPLDMPFEPTSHQNKDRVLWPEVLELALPKLRNLRRVDLSYAECHAKSTGRVALRAVAKACKQLEAIAWRGHDRCAPLVGHPLERFRRLTELDMDGACFYVDSPFPDATCSSSGSDRCILQFYCDTLERVSIKGARFRCIQDDYVGGGDVASLGRGGGDPIPQAGLVAFVRRAPNLRWFRSDLAPPSVAVLRRERPGVIFAS